MATSRSKPWIEYVLGIALATALVIAGIVGSPGARAEAATRFSDVDSSTPFESDIYWLVDKSITTGWADGSFRPEANVTRDAFAAFLYRLSGEPVYTPPASSQFADVATTDPFYREISWLQTRNITTGWINQYGTREFRPYQQIGRDAVAAFLYRFAKAQNGSDAGNRFNDVKTSEFRNEIGWLADNELTTGWADGGFHPYEKVRRSAIAAFLHRLTAKMLSPAATEEKREYAINVLDRLPTSNQAPATGYTRDQFGKAWSDVDGNGCDTRNDILARDLADTVIDAKCLVLSGVLNDPYTGRTISFQRGQTTSTAVQIDHLVALSNAWKTGAQNLTPGQRLKLANDRDNLLAVDGPTNAAKGDKDASAWLPPLNSFHCKYVARQIDVKATYSLWVTSAERESMRQVLNACPLEQIDVAEATQPAPPLPDPSPEPAPAPAPVPDQHADVYGITPGAFCKKTQRGQIGRSDEGKYYRCVADGKNSRWRPL